MAEAQRELAETLRKIIETCRNNHGLEVILALDCVFVLQLNNLNDIEKGVLIECLKRVNSLPLLKIIPVVEILSEALNKPIRRLSSKQDLIDSIPKPPKMKLNRFEMMDEFKQQLTSLIN